jgi:hypothetical protein
MARAITPVRGAPNVQWNCNPKLKSHAKSNKLTWNQEQKQLKNYQLPRNLLKPFRKSETFVKNFHEAATPFKIIAPYPVPSSIKYRCTANLCFYPRKHCQVFSRIHFDDTILKQKTPRNPQALKLRSWDLSFRSTFATEFVFQHISVISWRIFDFSTPVWPFGPCAQKLFWAKNAQMPTCSVN